MRSRAPTHGGIRDDVALSWLWRAQSRWRQMLGLLAATKFTLTAPQHHERVSAMLDDMLRQIVRDEVRAAFAEAAAGRHGAAPAGEWLTISQAAAFASVHRSTVHAWLKDGSLSHTGAGRRTRIARADLVALIERGMRARGATETPDEVAERLLAQAG